MRNFVGRLTWVQSDGGPLLLLSRPLLRRWNGIRTPGGTLEEYDPEDFCDYNLACRVRDCLGSVPVGRSAGLVLGEEPMMTTWRSLNGVSLGQGLLCDGLLARWGYGHSEDDMIEALASVPSRIWKLSGIVVTVGAPLCLFDSACPGEQVREEESLSVDLPAGSYSIATGWHRPNKKTSLLLHAFTRQEAPEP